MISNNSKSLKVFTIEKIQKLSKAKDFSNRPDVINKTALRKMRKYYSDMFKSANKKLVRLRFCNSKVEKSCGQPKLYSKMNLEKRKTSMKFAII